MASLAPERKGGHVWWEIALAVKTLRESGEYADALTKMEELFDARTNDSNGGTGGSDPADGAGADASSPKRKPARNRKDPQGN